MTGYLLRDAELDGQRHADVRLRDGIVTDIAPQLSPRTDETVLDADGGALLPGLCDHHLHLHALAARDRSVLCGPPEVTDALALANGLARAPADAHGWVRGVGYQETVAGDLTAAVLDRLHAARPVRIQHRSGALWSLNSAAAAAAGLADGDHPGIERDEHGRPTGRLWRADDWLRTRLPTAELPDLAPVGTRLAQLGITAVTDATPDLAPTALAAITDAMRTGALPQRVHLLGAPLDWQPPPGQHVPPASPHVPSIGPYKIVLADSDLPALDSLTDRVRTAHRAGRAIAAHCVTREALLLLLAAMAAAGVRAGDRIEHAALVPVELLPQLAEQQLRVVTQPGFLAHRGDDFLRDLPPVDHPDLYRARSLTDANIPLGLSSDAPYGPLDPWTVLAAATDRRTPNGRVANAAERLTPAQALAAYLSAPADPGGPARPVRPGADADLVLLHAPLATAFARPAADLVRATFIAGNLVWPNQP